MSIQDSRYTSVHADHNTLPDLEDNCRWYWCKQPYEHAQNGSRHNLNSSTVTSASFSFAEQGSSPICRTGRMLKRQALT
jgi:hypothetical protein